MLKSNDDAEMMKVETAKHAYRPEIDGLRAVAVIAVIIYHLDITFLGVKLAVGGFLGVDVFFVISGFLITGILVHEFNVTGSVSITRFYIRRARRILPPLVFMIVWCVPVAFAILLPSEINRFALSILSVLVFLSNFFWFFELSEYGAQSGLLQPFLHTWSLAIEEQFYLIFPPLLLLLLRKVGPQTTGVVLGLALCAGLVAAQGLTAVHPAFSFYAPTSRAWELLAGSVLALAAMRAPNAFRSDMTCRVIPPLAIAVLCICFCVFNLEVLAHPGFATVPVILATCSLIWFATPTEPMTSALSCPAAVWIGRLSFSLYLWHFPVFAFGRIVAIDQPGGLDMLIWLAVTMLAATLSYYLVESPFRHQVPIHYFAGVMASGTAVLGLGCLLIVSGRIVIPVASENLSELYGAANMDNEALGLATWQPLAALSPKEDIGPWNAVRPSMHEKANLWFTQDHDHKVLIIGDSHAKDVYNALILNNDRFAGTGFARFNLHRKTLAQDLIDLHAAPNFKVADTIIIAPRYYREYRQTLETILAAVTDQRKHIIVLGATAEFDAGGELPLFDWYLRMANARDALDNLNMQAINFETPGAVRLEDDIRHIATTAGASFLSRRALVCPEQACTIVTADGQKTMYDDTHWTLKGAALFGHRAAEAGWLAN
jgi:peptidoglycan/LPS O-acetylase OafA/YrhL